MKLKGAIGPRAEIESKIMQATTGFKDRVAKARLPVANFVFHNPIAFDTANGMFNPGAQRGKPAVLVLVKLRQLLVARLLFGLQNRHLLQAEALKAGILSQSTPLWQRVVYFLRQPFVVPLALDRVGDKQHLPLRVDDDIVLYGVPFFLPL